MIDQRNINQKKQYLFDQLNKEKVFWPYSQSSVSLKAIGDTDLISYTMRYLDLNEIKILFEIYPLKKIKDAWKKVLVPEGEFLYTLNRFFAWYYFKAKRPDAYLKSLQTRHLNKLLSE